MGTLWSDFRVERINENLNRNSNFRQIFFFRLLFKNSIQVLTSSFGQKKIPIFIQFCPENFQKEYSAKSSI